MAGKGLAQTLSVSARLSGPLQIKVTVDALACDNPEIARENRPDYGEGLGIIVAICGPP